MKKMDYAAQERLGYTIAWGGVALMVIALVMFLWK
jgi:hypothetical protein